MLEKKLEAEVQGKTVQEISSPEGEYEFKMDENEVISGLAASMKFVGVVSMVLGIIQAIGGVLTGMNLPGIIGMVQGIVLITIGGWLIGAAGSFRDIVKTEGSDIAHLMNALRKLRSVYALQAWLLGLACALAVLLIILAFSAASHHGF